MNVNGQLSGSAFAQNPANAGTMRRLEKLLAIASDERADPNEAAACAKQAENIMRKFQLEQADVIITALKAGDDLNTVDREAYAADKRKPGATLESVPPWASMLGLQIALYNDCGCMITRNVAGDKVIRFFGFSADTELAGFMFDYLVGTIKQLCRLQRKNRDVDMNSYRRGVQGAITGMLIRAVKERADEMKSQSAKGNELMVVKQDAIAKEFGKKVLGQKNTSLSSPRDGASYAAGRVDGSKVDITRRAIRSDAAHTLRIAGK